MFRSVLFLATATVGAAALFGCTFATGSGSEGDNALRFADDAEKAADCPHFVSPVCGKDGKTYSNYCYAGGSNNLERNVACQDSCKTVGCGSAMHCELEPIEGGATAVCIQDVASRAPTCFMVTCAGGYHCETKGIKGASIATCMENEKHLARPSCVTLTCGGNYHCEMKALDGGAFPACVRN